MTASTTTTLAEIRELNLAYLLLAQQLLVADRASAMARLALSDDVAQLLASLSPAQAVRVASSSHLLCRFRFDDHAILFVTRRKGQKRSAGRDPPRGCIGDRGRLICALIRADHGGVCVPRSQR
ncbi:flagellar transcriptional regulator FlhD [Caballeronia sp. GAFFF2]|uniref:flagellar transcriptional regulator FlhD n=1 Tax=Caballeronia sp. GAFFF2 TaxID=2921741 RepID=UPI0020299410|nr:flagellar transcriptional regulator FlhD [Caballeronia sp. GAFFF2]